MSKKDSIPNDIIHTFVVLAYKESPFLEECIKSVLTQTCPSHVVVATSTPCSYIQRLANKYHLRVIVNRQSNHGIGGDFDFALSCGHTPLVTIAHQDDVYEPGYSKAVMSAYCHNPNCLIIFTDYYEVRNGKKVTSGPVLRAKRMLLMPLRIFKGKTRLIKRSSICFGNAICCPAVTFNMKKLSLPIYDFGFKGSVDWDAWERLSRKSGSFVYLPQQPLLGHRIHEDTATSEAIRDSSRAQEDIVMLSRFWPKPIAHRIARVYGKSADNNNLTSRK